MCWEGLAARCSKANKQARLVERKVCFISDARNCRGGWQTSVQKPTPTPPCPEQAEGESFYRQELGGGYMQK